MIAADESLETLRASAEESARRAGRVLSEKWGMQRTIEYKGGIDLVTDADRAAEAVLLAYLRERHPGHAVLAEESGATEGAGMRWIVDPLDGTTNYSHRVPHFCVSVAVEDERGLAAGAIYDPVRDELYSAARGRGATLNGAALRVSNAAALERSLLSTGFPYDVREHPDGPVGLFNRFIRRAQGIRRMGSAALDLAYVAAGRYDGYFEFGLKPWDVAAGALLVKEAGGAMTHIDGVAFDVGRGDVLACAPGIAQALGEECQRFLAEMHWSPTSGGRFSRPSATP